MRLNIGAFARGKDIRWTRFATALAPLLVAFAALSDTTSATDLHGSDAGVLKGPSPLIGARSEFQRRLFSIHNPYCAILTYVIPDLSEQASSTQDANGRSIIAIDAPTYKTDRAYAHFLMAHECCHHTLGHTRITSQSFGQLGPQPFYYIRPLLKNMELDADGCAVRLLTLNREFDAIESARKTMFEFGAAPTGAYYPTGSERAENIVHAARESISDESINGPR
jgi:hypothetical protein